MRASLLILALLCLLLLGCTEPGVPPDGGFAFTGEGAKQLTPTERAGTYERHSRVVECLRGEGVKITDQLKEIRVHPTCWFFKWGRWIKGTTNLRDRVELGIDLGEFEHETAALYSRHSHETGSPNDVCGSPLSWQWAKEHPRRPCEPRPTED